MRIGILGGTFSPPHLGHLCLAQKAIEKADLEKVIFIPCGNPPHKNVAKVLDAKHRLEMVRLAISQNPKFELSDIEVISDEPSYTAKTLKKLKKIYTEDDICFIVGADSLCYIDSWYSPQEIFDNAEIIAACRGGKDALEFSKAIEHCEEKYKARITRLEMNVDISSSDIRKRLKHGKNVDGMLTEDVRRYIGENKLYEGKV